MGYLAGQDVEYLQSEEFKQINMPFSEAVRVGNLLFLSGQIGDVYTDIPGQTKLAEGGIRPETRQTMENIKSVLERYGLTLENVVKCTCMLADIKEWGEMSEEYIKYFPINKPARSAFAGTGLAMGARV
ncbi:MAG TPA: RidA family protein [Candidatus Marinimicrobia bacterium]|nr:RidA family protein [Candidatus Neomarinimicrobiota bacterium]